MTTENWLPVTGYEGLYAVSDMGRVRSEGRHVPRRAISGSVYAVSDTLYINERIIKQQINLEGYYTVCLCRNGGHTKYTVHTIVLKAFRSLPAEGEVTRHLDSNKLNNNLSNLKWGTQSENIHDQVDAGTHRNASKTHCKRGHEFTQENTRNITGTTHRRCRECDRVRQGHNKRSETHCRNGHERTPENTTGRKRCRICKNERDLESYHRRKELKNAKAH